MRGTAPYELLNHPHSAMVFHQGFEFSTREGGVCRPYGIIQDFSTRVICAWEVLHAEVLQCSLQRLSKRIPEF